MQSTQKFLFYTKYIAAKQNFANFLNFLAIFFSIICLMMEPTVQHFLIFSTSGFYMERRKGDWQSYIREDAITKKTDLTINSTTMKSIQDQIAMDMSLISKLLHNCSSAQCFNIPCSRIWLILGMILYSKMPMILKQLIRLSDLNELFRNNSFSQDFFYENWHYFRMFVMSCNKLANFEFDQNQKHVFGFNRELLCIEPSISSSLIYTTTTTTTTLNASTALLSYPILQQMALASCCHSDTYL